MSAPAVSLPPSTLDAILDAAERRFADAGFAGASVRDIANDVGLKNQASLYHYFRNKNEMYEAVVQRAVDQLVPLWDGAGRAIASAAPAGRVAAVAAYLDRVLELLAARPQLARLIERAGLDEDRFARNTASERLRPLYVAGIRVLQEAGGPWRQEELPHLAAGLYHLIFGYFANSALLDAVMGEDIHGAETLARQRTFLAAAIARLLGIDTIASDRAAARKE